MRLRIVPLLGLLLLVSVGITILRSMLGRTDSLPVQTIRAERSERLPPNPLPVRNHKPWVTVTTVPAAVGNPDSPDRGPVDPLDGVPKINELDAIHPGLTKAVRQGRAEARRQVMRDLRKCSLLLPDESMVLEW